MKTPAQNLIMQYLREHPDGVVGAVRVVQRAKGYANDSQCGGGELLHPLYALVRKGLVVAEPTGHYAWGIQIMRYRAAEVKP